MTVISATNCSSYSYTPKIVRAPRTHASWRTLSPQSTCGKVRAPSCRTLRVEQQIRAGGNADFWTETSRMIYSIVETEVERLNDVGCDHTSDRRSRRRRKTVWRRLAKSMTKVA